MSRKFLSIAAPLVGMCGCIEFDVTEFESLDTFSQNPWEKVDILLVIDNSGSMEPYQEKLATDFGAFFELFDQGEVDWQLAVVHTDGFDWTLGKIRGPIVTPDSEDPEALFAEVVRVGTSGYGLEVGLESAARALSGLNAGFPRDDTSISVIFVSDEQDSSPSYVADYVNRFFDVRGQRSRDAFNASALTVTDIADCSPDQFQVSSPGTRYIEAAELTGGITANLCREDFDPIVRELALTTSAMRDTFFLSHFPAPDSLELHVEDLEIPCDAGEWSYLTLEEEGVRRPAIRFEDGYIPASNARITVRYRHGSGDPEDFCPGAGG